MLAVAAVRSSTWPHESSHWRSESIVASAVEALRWTSTTSAARLATPSGGSAPPVTTYSLASDCVASGLDMRGRHTDESARPGSSWVESSAQLIWLS